MTRNQSESHNEQMEAARADFESLWHYELKPAACSLDMHQHMTDRDFAFMQHLCWLAFSRAKGVQ